jgi:hypothetical protein
MRNAPPQEHSILVLKSIEAYNRNRAMRASDSTGNQAISMAATTMEGSKISEVVDKTRNMITLVTFHGDRFGVTHGRKGTISGGQALLRDLAVKKSPAISPFSLAGYAWRWQPHHTQAALLASTIHVCPTNID